MLKNLIYILQSENYDFKRFLNFAYSHFAWWKLENRQKIVWTAKARAVWIASALIFWILIGVSFYFFGAVGLIIFPILIIILPFLVGFSFALLWPIDTLVKYGRTNAAKKIILNSKVCVVGITGSYGKTSTKEILTVMLENKFKVIKTPENVNTDIGIADFVVKNKNNFQEEAIFVAEMGAYRKGEIAKICRMVEPTYSILTGINEAHLERFGSFENIIAGKFELPQNTRIMAFLNFDDTNIKENYSKFSLENIKGISQEDAQNIKAKENFGGLEFKWKGMAFETNLLAQHNIALILLSGEIALELGISLEEIREVVRNIEPVAHRLQPIYNASTDIMIIDDSYNGNPNGIASGLKVLGRASGRKVVLTPGLVELGVRAKDVHQAIGKLYVENADLVLLIKNKMTKYIVEALKESGFTSYKTYDSTQEAHADLKNILKRGDTIIFQNDLTDNYF
ncbi:MAG: UDP-N-acetylmuramoyl-tripeptide--D-alanyl-D-alanine ligase [Parcubacteria group bacterium]|jgi:UDP-N-acetylmuramoyl-tripeptide--D-alanyl-D-alanine ligase